MTSENPVDPTDIASMLFRAFMRRHDLLVVLQAKDTNCYRLFHGTAEGMPGVTIDRYGRQVLIQTFHHGLAIEELQVIRASVNDFIESQQDGLFAYRDRSTKASTVVNNITDEVGDIGPLSCRENGVRFLVKHRETQGNDPYLFLDLRNARDHVQQRARGKSVLNLFAYTCGVGICAAVGGASEVWNVDFAESSLAIGKQSAQLNEVDLDAVRFVQGDYFQVVRQLAGLKPGGKRPHQSSPQARYAPKRFDLTFLDPPRWAKSRDGTVDLVRDYQSVFKPALLATKQGGEIICCNNAAEVELDKWLIDLRRCVEKQGRHCCGIEVIAPGEDFPSWDGRHPLKIAAVQV